MIRLRLYTTLGCHLCERLEALLASLCAVPYRLERVEISGDSVMVERYGVRIPVLVDEAGVELDRGFEPRRLADWLAARGGLSDAAWQRLQGQPDEAVRHREEGDTEERAFSHAGRRYLG